MPVATGPRAPQALRSRSDEHTRPRRVPGSVPPHHGLDAGNRADGMGDVVRGVAAADAEGARLKAQDDVQALREILRALVRQLDEDGNRDGDAPGHSHSRRGIWDGDNGTLAGKPCAWCALWDKAKAVSMSSAEIKWPAPSTDAVEPLAELQDDWDGYGSRKPLPQELQTARELLAVLEPWTGWQVVPVGGGGVQIERHADGLDVEIFINGAPP